MVARAKGYERTAPHIQRTSWLVEIGRFMIVRRDKEALLRAQVSAFKAGD
jgi:hypothetical protein